MLPFAFHKDLNNCCRTCLNSIGKMRDLSSYRLDSTLAEILNFCTNIKVDNDVDDKLPKKLCNSCYDCLVSFYDFRRQAEKIDRDLKNNISTPLKIEVKSETGDFKIKIEPGEVKVENKCDDDVKNYTDNNSTHANDSDNSSTHASDNEYDKDNLNDPDFHCDDFTDDDDDDDESPSKPDHKLQQQNIKITKYLCEICKKTYHQLDKFHLHVIKHEKKPLHCNQCWQSYSQKEDLIKHLQNHDLEETEKKLKKNKNVGIKNVNIKIMKYDESKKILLNSDKIVKNFRCDVCSLTFKSIFSLSAHSRKHKGKQQDLSCSVCKKVFKRSHHLKRHMLVHDDSRLFKCSLCPRKFVRESVMQDHMSACGTDTVAREKVHKCTLCSKAFIHWMTLQKHLDAHNEKRTFICAYCGKTFTSGTNLNVHIRRHIGLKKYQCSYCPLKFYSNGELKSHTVTHTGIKSHSCDECGATFTKRTSLTKHKKCQHLGLRPFQCDTCPLRFPSKNHLTRHYRIHTGEKPYKCDACERAFSQNNDLLKHRRLHHGHDLYRCNECSQSFRLMGELRRHRSVHYLASRNKTTTDNTTTDNQNSSEAQTKDNDDAIDNGNTTSKGPIKRKKSLDKIAENLLDITTVPTSN